MKQFSSSQPFDGVAESMTIFENNAIVSLGRIAADYREFGMHQDRYQFGQTCFIVGQIEAEENPDRVQRLLAHLRTARAVRIHLESLVKYGAIAAKQIEFEERREEVKKRFPWLPPW